MYGSDYPFTGAKFVKQLLDRLDAGLDQIFETAEDRDGVRFGNAQKLLAK
jgi:predicted TIM-barrel fold metal-dependent hydrolase